MVRGGALPRPLDRPRLSLQVQPVLTVFAAQVFRGPQRLRPRCFLGGFLRLLWSVGGLKLAFSSVVPSGAHGVEGRLCLRALSCLAWDSINWTLGAGG